MHTKEMRSGLIDESTVIDEDRLAAFVLRVRRAALEGTANKKLRIMARYFFRTAPLPKFSSDAAADFFAITEQLTDTDMRCLTLMKRKREEENFNRIFEPSSKASPLTVCDVDFADVFPDLRSLNEAAFALGRFGLVYSGTTADSTGITLSRRGFDYR